MVIDDVKVKKGYIWVKMNYPNTMNEALVPRELVHHGIKGQKWGVRNGPPYPLAQKESVEKTGKGGIVKTTVAGHKGISKQGIPNSITDHIGRDGTVDKRAFYNEYGWNSVEIHTTDHNRPKWHPYGEHGEHVHYHTWDYETGQKIDGITDEIPTKLRKENQDIL